MRILDRLQRFAKFGALGIAFLIAVMTAVTSRMTVYGYLAETD